MQMNKGRKFKTNQERLDHSRKMLFNAIQAFDMHKRVGFLGYSQYSVLDACMRMNTKEIKQAMKYARQWMNDVDYFLSCEVENEPTV